MWQAEVLKNCGCDSVPDSRIDVILERLVRKGALKKRFDKGEALYYSEEATYRVAKGLFDGANSIEKIQTPLAQFEILGDYKDSKEYAEKCRYKINDIKYSEILKKLDNADDEGVLRMVAERLDELGDHGDASRKASECRARAKALADDKKKQTAYDRAMAKAGSTDLTLLKQAADEMAAIGDWKDAPEQAKKLKRRVDDVLSEEERHEFQKMRASRKRKITMILAGFGAVALLVFIIIFFAVSPWRTI